MNTRSPEALVAEFCRAVSKRPEGASHLKHPFTAHEADLLRLVRAAYKLGYAAAEVDNWIPNP